MASYALERVARAHGAEPHRVDEIERAVGRSEELQVEHVAGLSIAIRNGGCQQRAAAAASSSSGQQQRRPAAALSPSSPLRPRVLKHHPEEVCPLEKLGRDATDDERGLARAVVAREMIHQTVRDPRMAREDEAAIFSAEHMLLQQSKCRRVVREAHGEGRRCP